MKHPQSNLPPGFRFHPTDHELIIHYLSKKVASLPLPVSLIADVDIYKLDPWDLPGKAAFGEKEWYFFSPRDRKYPNGARPNRAAGSGYWKATGTDKNIASAASQNTIVGVKKALVFYKGKPPKGVKTNWIMHEYRLAHSTTKPIKLRDTSMRLDDWVLCRIYNKSKHDTSSSSTPEAPSMVADDPAQDHHQLLEQALLPASTSSTAMNVHLPPHHTTTLASNKSLSFSNLLDAVDYSMLSSILSDQGHNYSNPTAPASVNGAVGGGNIPDHHLAVPTAPDMERGRPKRQLPYVDEEALYPSKKSQLSSCSFPEPSHDHQCENSNPQYWNLLHRQQLLSQQLLLGPHLRFQQ